MVLGPSFEVYLQRFFREGLFGQKDGVRKKGKRNTYDDNVYMCCAQMCHCVCSCGVHKSKEIGAGSFSGYAANKFLMLAH